MQRSITASQLHNDREIVQGFLHALAKILLRRIWLPKILYEMIPYFYLATGLGALWSAIYIVDWFWFLPVYVIFSTACIHFACFLFGLRRRAN